MLNILFICTGNTCRSPMAEALLKEKAPDWNVKSAGIHAFDGGPIAENAKHVLEKRNISLQHSSKRVTKKLLSWADYVITMTVNHRDTLTQIEPKYKEKYFTLKELVQRTDIKKKEEVKEKLKQFEQKKEKLINKYSHLTDEKLNELLNKKLLDEYLYLQTLQNKHFSNDVLDPFGQSLQVYEKTANELNHLIEKLIQYLNKK